MKYYGKFPLKRNGATATFVVYFSSKGDRDALVQNVAGASKCTFFDTLKSGCISHSHYLFLSDLPNEIIGTLYFAK